MAGFCARKTVCLITGASQDIGAMYSQHFAQNLAEGSMVILSSRSKARLQKLKDEQLKPKDGVEIALVEWDFQHPNADLFNNDLKSCTKGKTYDQALLIHNAAGYGDMNKKVSELQDTEAIRNVLDLNLTSMLVVNSAFLTIFKSVASKIVVNMTAPSAVNPEFAFGLVSALKGTRQCMLNIMAKEDPTIKLLNYSPGMANTNSMRAIRDTAADPKMREKFKAFFDQGKVKDPKVVAEILGKVLVEEKFKSGEYIECDSLL